MTPHARIEPIVHAMLDHVERILAQVAPPWHMRLPPALRARLCARAACRRARLCHTPRACRTRLAGVTQRPHR